MLGDLDADEAADLRDALLLRCGRALEHDLSHRTAPRCETILRSGGSPR